MTTALATASYLKRQRQRQNVGAFAALVDTPAVGTVVIPANGMFALVTPAIHAAGAAAVVTGPRNRTISVPAMVAAKHRPIGKLEEGSSVVLQAWVDLYVDTGLGKYQKICRGS